VGNIGDELKKIRRNRNLTLVELSNLSGVGKSTISDIENGKINPSVKTVIKLSESLGVESQVLFKENEETSMNNLKNEVKSNEEKIDSFTVKLVNELLTENIIQDPDNIPEEIVKMIMLKLKEDIKKRNANQ